MVAVAGEDLRERALARFEMPVEGRMAEVVETVALRPAPGQQGAAAGRTFGRGAERISQRHAFTREPVDVGSRNGGASVAAEMPSGVVQGAQQNVGRVLYLISLIVDLFHRFGGGIKLCVRKQHPMYLFGTGRPGSLPRQPD